MTISSQFSDHFSGEKINIDDLLLLIENNSGAKGLDLSGKDFSGIKLEPKILNKIRRDKKLKKRPVWQNDKGGINLQGANLSWSLFNDADLGDGCLRNADLRGAKLERADLIDTDLSGAVLWDVSLNYAVLDGANLQGANLFGAVFDGSTLIKDSIGDNIIQESKKYTVPRGMTMLPERNRFWQASKIYRHLKSTFDNSGLYDNASWAYRKARKMEKLLAKHNVGLTWHKKQWNKSFQNIVKWFSDSLIEAISDYGENPWRVLVCINLVWLGFSILYGFLAGVINSESGVPTHNAVDLLAFSLGTMTTIEPVGLSPNNIWYMRFIMPFETLLGIAFTGLFGFVLGNRINRV